MKKNTPEKFISAFVCTFISLLSLCFTACGKGGESHVLTDTPAPAAEKPPAETNAPSVEVRYTLPEKLKGRYALFSLVLPADEEIAELGCKTEPIEISFILPKGWRCEIKRGERVPLPAVCGNSPVPDYYFELYDRAGALAGALDFHKYALKPYDNPNDPKSIYAVLTESENFFLLKNRSEPSEMQAEYKIIPNDGDNITALTKAAELQHNADDSSMRTDYFPAIVSYDPFRQFFIALEFFSYSDSPAALNTEQFETIAESVRIY